jgi:myo-inositol 2-dehydrogenase/D-chiro-inositol 1-dehydrogenase
MLKCCSRDNPMPPMPYLKVSGGIFYDMLTHDFDMIHFLSGEIPTEVYSVGHCYDEEIKAMDDVDTVMVTLKFASGLMATVDTSRVAPYGYDQRVEAFGEKGMATAHNEKESTVVVASAAGYVHPRSHKSFPERYKTCYTEEMAEFVAMVKAGTTESEETVRRHVILERVTAAAELSHRLGRAIKLDEVDGLRDQMPH